MFHVCGPCSALPAHCSVGSSVIARCPFGWVGGYRFGSTPASNCSTRSDQILGSMRWRSYGDSDDATEPHPADGGRLAARHPPHYRLGLGPMLAPVRIPDHHLPTVPGTP